MEERQDWTHMIDQPTNIFNYLKNITDLSFFRLMIPKKKIVILTSTIPEIFRKSAQSWNKIHVEDKLLDQNGWNFDTKTSLYTL